MFAGDKQSSLFQSSVSVAEIRFITSTLGGYSEKFCCNESATTLRITALILTPSSIMIFSTNSANF
jgi:hypothetical protein